jgi:hypothetical protein
MTTVSEQAPIASTDIEARLAVLAEYLKDAERSVSLKKSDLRYAESARDRIKREIEAWSEALAALRKAGLNL